MWIEILEGVTVYAAGAVSGLLIGHEIYRKKPDDEILRQYMERIVNVEAIEEHERLLKFRMARQGRRQIRLDGGPNAVMRRMRVNPRKTTGGSTTA